MPDEPVPGEPFEDPDVHARRWSILSVLCLSLVLVVMAVAGLNVALPTIQKDLAASGTELLWIVSVYPIVFAGLLLPAGALGDKYGRRTTLQAGLIGFGLGAVIAAVASTPIQVIVGRAVMGAGAAFTMPATLSIISVVFPPRERFRAIAIWAGFAGAGGNAGPVLSGVLLTGWWILPRFGWESTFLVNLPVVVIVLAAVTFVVPNSKESVSTPLDPVGGIFSMAAITALLFGIIEGPELGWTHPLVLGGFVVAAAIGGTFAKWEMRTAHPMLPMQFFRNRRFSVGGGAVTLVYALMFAFFFLLTLYLQFVLGYTPLKAGVATLPFGAAMMVLSPQAARLSTRFGTGPVMIAGFLITAAGLALLITISTSTSYPILGLIFTILGAGVVLASTPATADIVAAVPPDKAGVASAVNDTTRELGGAFGLAVGGSLAATIYGATLDLSAIDLSPAVADAARESLGAALGAAAGLGTAVEPLVVEAAHEAFTSAFAWTMGTFAVASLLAASATWWFTRELTTDPSADAGDPLDV